MATQPDTLQKILLYANNVQDPEAVPDETTSSAAQAAHEARLSKTVAELQKRVQEQQAALEKVIT